MTVIYDKKVSNSNILEVHLRYYFCQAHKAVLCMMSWSTMSSSRNVRCVSLMWMYTLKVPRKYVTAFMAITVSVCTQQKDTLFQQFLIAVSLEGLENKYSLELSRGQIKYSISDMYYSGQKFTFSLRDNICCLKFISRGCFYFCEGHLYNIKFICVFLFISAT